MADAIKKLAGAGFDIIATGGTHKFLLDNEVACEKVNKVLEGRPHIVDALKNNDVQLVINTTYGKKTVSDSQAIRRSALIEKVPYYTTIPGAIAAIDGILAYSAGNLDVRPLQDYLA